MTTKSKVFDFSQALHELKDGACVRRAGWNGKGMHIYLETANIVKVRGGVYKGATRIYDPCIVMLTAQGKHQPGWLASQADLLAEDWEIAAP